MCGAARAASAYCDLVTTIITTMYPDSKAHCQGTLGSTWAVLGPGTAGPAGTAAVSWAADSSHRVSWQLGTRQCPRSPAPATSCGTCSREADLRASSQAPQLCCCQLLYSNTLIDLFLPRITMTTARIPLAFARAVLAFWGSPDRSPPPPPPRAQTAPVLLLGASASAISFTLYPATCVPTTPVYQMARYFCRLQCRAASEQLDYTAGNLKCRDAWQHDFFSGFATLSNTFT